jgi:hypothetical protein
MGEGYATTFESLRPHILDRLVEVRGAIDHGYAAIADDVIRAQFDQVLDRMQAYLTDGDNARYRGFASRWVAMRIGEGFPPENIAHALVAFGDVVVQVGKHRLGTGDDAMKFVRAATQMNFALARMIVEILADDMAARREQRNAMPVTSEDPS